MIQFLYLFLLLGNFIPVSLYVSMSTVKFCQGFFMRQVSYFILVVGKRPRFGAPHVPGWNAFSLRADAVVYQVSNSRWVGVRGVARGASTRRLRTEDLSSSICLFVRFVFILT